MATLALPPLLIAAPPTLLRLGLEATLREARPELELTITADPNRLAALLEQPPAPLLILDLLLIGATLDHWMAYLDALPRPQPVLVIGGRRCSPRLARALAERPYGRALSARATPADLVQAVDRLLAALAAGTACAEPRALYTRRAAGVETITLFSPRELEVLRLVAADCTNHEIAAQLEISIRTVEAHRRVLLEKGGTRSMVGLVMHAVRHGWLQVA